MWEEKTGAHVQHYSVMVAIQIFCRYRECVNLKYVPKSSRETSSGRYITPPKVMHTTSCFHVFIFTATAETPKSSRNSPAKKRRADTSNTGKCSNYRLLRNNNFHDAIQESGSRTVYKL